MTLQPIKDMNEYKRLKESLKSRFEADKTGEQTLFIEQTKLLKPLINVQQDTGKEITKQIATNQDAITRELQRQAIMYPPLAIDAPHAQASTPIYPLTQQATYLQAPQATPTQKAPQAILTVDLDAGLNKTDIENLEDMDFELPSKVFETQNYDDTLEKIKMNNRQIGQYLSKTSKLPAHEKEVHESRKKTLNIYKEKIEDLEGASKFVSTPKKKGSGLTDVIYYPSFDDLCRRLSELLIVKKAGNNGVNNDINAILDELLEKGAIDKTKYNGLYHKIFSEK
jgi:hypothetical protein